MVSEYIEPKIFNRLLSLMPRTSARALRLSLATGMRIGDVLSLKRENLVGDEVFFMAQKTGKEGRAKLPKALLRELRECAGAVWLFPSPRDFTRPLTRQAVYIGIKRACKDLQIKGQISPHSARKIFAVCDRREHGIAHTQRALQHDRRDTTKIYAFSDLTDLDGFLGEIAALRADIRRVYEQNEKILSLLCEFSSKKVDKTKKP